MHRCNDMIVLAALCSAAALLSAKTAGEEPQNPDQANAQGTELPGKITDPDIIAPPGPRTPYSGAPADWKNFIQDSQRYAFTVIDRFEYGNSAAEETYLWDAQGWIGGDLNRFWWKTEGEGPTSDEPEQAEFQALYNRTISPFWGVQVGLRYDLEPHDTAHAVLGLQGLAPYWFETDMAMFISDEGDVSFRAEFEYDLLLTQRLILQPRLEINASANDVPERGLGSGINDTEAGLRLRYEILREFAPYIGVRWTRKYGETRAIARALGEPKSDTALVLGIRAWF